jgi:hypothetical protein
MSKPQKIIAMTGSTGFVGTELQKQLGSVGWKIIPLGRPDFQGEAIDLAEKLTGAQVIINLAGAPVIGRWTKPYKKKLYESRVVLTRKLVTAISLMAAKPESLISTSAVGIYASEGSHTEENYTRADTYLGRLATEWEDAALAAEKLGVRTVIFRLGVVFGREGGALLKMLLPFKLGLGGTIGTGEQALSWIHINDLVNAYEAAVKERSFHGIYNLSAPEPTTNKELTKTLGQLLSRPTLLPVPAFVLYLLFGEGAQILTSGQKAYPKRLQEAGYTFQFGHLRTALKNCLQ